MLPDMQLCDMHAVRAGCCRRTTSRGGTCPPRSLTRGTTSFTSFGEGALLKVSAKTSCSRLVTILMRSSCKGCQETGAGAVWGSCVWVLGCYRGLCMARNRDWLLRKHPSMTDGWWAGWLSAYLEHLGTCHQSGSCEGRHPLLLPDRPNPPALLLLLLPSACTAPPTRFLCPAHSPAFPLPFPQVLAAILSARLGGAATICGAEAALGRARSLPGHRARLPGWGAGPVAAGAPGDQMGVRSPICPVLVRSHVRQLVSLARLAVSAPGARVGAEGICVCSEGIPVQSTQHPAGAAVQWMKHPSACMLSLQIPAHPFLVHLLCVLPGCPCTHTCGRPLRASAAHTCCAPAEAASLCTCLRCRSQHIFVDPANPRSDYRLTYNCVDCPDNSRTFNDGYHIVHHLNSQVQANVCNGSTSRLLLGVGE